MAIRMVAEVVGDEKERPVVGDRACSARDQTAAFVRDELNVREEDEVEGALGGSSP